jgi:GNAT superfamily N-acetyltransferase
MPFQVRPFQPDDAAAVDDLWRSAFSGFEAEFPGAEDALGLGAARMAATGARILVAIDAAGGCVGAVLWGTDEGIGAVSLLVSAGWFAGRDLVREVERRAQRAGLRVLRATTPPEPALADYAWFLGYREVARDARSVTFERRLPLLTVREQRRTDAEGIAHVAGVDPWPFEQGARPGWFVLADGDRITGVASVKEESFGVAVIDTLVLEDAYRGRDIETWMLVRAGDWAATHGFHTVSAPVALLEGVAERDLEDIGWFRDGARYVRRGDGQIGDDTNFESG